MLWDRSVCRRATMPTTPGCRRATGATPHCATIVAHARTHLTIRTSRTPQGSKRMPREISARSAPITAMPRRSFLQAAAGAAALPFLARNASAQEYPARPVRVIVGQAAGSSSDIIARLIGQRLSERLGQQFVVEDRPGAGGNIATESVVRASPDGYTLLLVNS